MTDFKTVPMRVWSPDGVVRTEEFLRCTADYVGNDVAEGRLRPEDYWQEMYAETRASLRCRDDQLRAARAERHALDCAILAKLYADRWVDRWLAQVDALADGATE